MNLFFTLLPLIISVGLLTSAGFVYITFKNSLEFTEVPEISRTEPDIEPIRTALSRVFSEDKEEFPSDIHREVGSPDISLLGIALGKRNLALLQKDREILILEEGKEKKGIILKKVFKDKVVLVIRNREVVLKIKKATPSPPPDRQKSTPTSEIKISRREVERLTKDPATMFREVRMVPYIRGGRTEGFIFEWIKPGSLLHRAGLRKGDVLLSINNMTIESAEDAFRLLQILRNEPSLKVVILRRGRKKEINVRIE